MARGDDSTGLIVSTARVIVAGMVTGRARFSHCTRAICLVAIVSSMAGCADLRLAIPPCTQVERIVVSQIPAKINIEHDSIRVEENKWQVTDRNRIKEFVLFLAERNDRWSRSWATVPSGRYAVSLESKDDFLLVVWVSPTFIGAPGNQMQNIGDEEWRVMTRILDLPADAKL